MCRLTDLVCHLSFDGSLLRLAIGHATCTLEKMELALIRDDGGASSGSSMARVESGAHPGLLLMFKFLHAADIHLDSPQRGLDRYEGAPVAECRGATRRALENLVNLAWRRRSPSW